MKAELYVSFYTSYKLQSFYLWIVRLLTLSYHTHVHVQLETPLNKYLIVIVNKGSPKIIKMGLKKELFGVAPYKKIYIGPVNYNQLDIDWIQHYPPTSIKEIFMYYIKTMLGFKIPIKNMPTNCVTFVCDYLCFHNIYIPKMFTPKELWRFYASDNVRR